MSEKDTEYFTICTQCVSFLSCSGVEEAQEKAESHNTQSHDGAERAMAVNVRDASELGRALNAMKKNAPGDEYPNFVRRMYNGNAPFFCPSALYKEAVPKADQY